MSSAPTGTGHATPHIHDHLTVGFMKKARSRQLLFPMSVFVGTWMHTHFYVYITSHPSLDLQSAKKSPMGGLMASELCLALFQLICCLTDMTEATKTN